MNRIRALALLLLSLVIVPAFAQRAVIIQLPSGQLIGIAYTTTGQVVLTDITLIKLDAPPNPTPPPVGDNPFPLPGLRMLILEETGDRLAIDPGQRDILLSSDVQEYLRTHAAKTGNQPEWRKLDDDFTDKDLADAKLGKLWIDAYHRAQKDAKYNPSTKVGETPWYVLSDGVKYESKPLPKGPTALPEFLELLKKYGGN